MASRRAKSPEGSVLLLVGTMKGAFLLWSDDTRKKWRVEGPHFHGESVYAMAHDNRAGRNRTFAATRNFHWGGVLRSSDDYGRTWSSPERQNVRFPEDSGLALVQIWQVAAGRPSEPDVLYCGVEPAALFESRDAGESWQPVEGLLRHEQRQYWQPGAGGLCLHTIIPDPTDPNRMHIAISAAGVYHTLIHISR
jgi:hypothetical protein